MGNDARLDQIVRLVDQYGYLSVQQLSELCDTSVITIRRDLMHLEADNRIRRTHGGAAAILQPAAIQQPVAILQPAAVVQPALEQPLGFEDEPSQDLAVVPRKSRLMLDRIDALIVTDALPGLGPFGSNFTAKRRIPVITESLALPDTETCVQVDNYQAGCALGAWAGQYARDRWGGRAVVLDLTYHRSNTTQRSQGFIDGIRQILPEAEMRLSINAQSRYDMVYQLTRDALSVHDDINIIFAVNDTSAYGAYNACKDMNIDPDKLIILPFGLEGPTVLDLVMEGKWCVAGLCMFPEVVGIACIEAAVAAYNHQDLPVALNTPYCVATRESLPEYYVKTEQGWQLQWDSVPCDLKLPFPLNYANPTRERRLPGRLAFIYTFVQHEWYKTMVRMMQEYTERLGIRLEIVDYETTLKDEMHQRRLEIARRAALEVKHGDTIYIDAGSITRDFAEQLLNHRDVTVITNSQVALEVLKENNAITLISTGGALRRSSQVFVGPTAEAAIKEFRIDKLFLSVSGVTKNFGLSHTNISEVTIKQLMIRSTREVILLADHSCFQQEALVQVAPVTVVHKLITDHALPASVRLELGTLGIQVIMATM
jgi:DeoR/GlpR family transcriptional regulator of sugar metabolism